MKAGVKTTEFWLTIAVNLASLLAAISEALPARYAALVSTVTTGLYALARGWAKNNQPPSPPAP